MAPGEALASALAFPEAEGFGAMATGGRNGQVVHVTTLADSGTGSLRDAVSGSNRIVVFDVSGVIQIASALVVAGDNITLAGQSAPAGGITIYGKETSFSSRSNIIVRYMRFRQGMGDTDSGAKAVNITDGQNMIFDHVAVQWGRWDNFGVTGTSTTVTLQNSIIGEGMPPQRFGSIMDSVQDITVARNLWINNESRNPKFKANGQYVNNVVYDWGDGGGVIGGHSSADWNEDLINNYLIAGPTSVVGFLTFYLNTDLVYQTGNMVDVNQDGQLNGRAVVEADFVGDTPPTFETVAYNKPSVPVTVVSAADAYAEVVAQAGTCQVRDAVETRLVGQLQSLGTTGAIIAMTGSEADVGGQPAMTEVTRPAGYDTDGDGMPDTWESAHGLNPNDPSDATGDYNGDGYTNVEKYLNEAADMNCLSGGTAALAEAGDTAGDAGVAPSTDAGPATGPDASTSGADAALERSDASTSGSDAAGVRFDASDSTPDASSRLPDAASYGGGADVVQPDAAVQPFDAASSLDASTAGGVDSGASSPTGPGDASAGTSTGPDAAESALGSPAEPSNGAGGCSCSIGAARSSKPMRWAPWAVALLLVSRGLQSHRRRRAPDDRNAHARAY
jgi:hypothetical protein